MNRTCRVFLTVCALAATAILVAACGTERITASKSNSAVYQGAVIFSQRCAGCHTLSYAATHGSASNIRDAEWTNGPNFDQRCERPVTRVLYAIENGGFSGLIMPQNIVVGQQARDVAMFVATYAGHQAPRAPGVPVCSSESIGTLPALTSGVATASAGTATSSTTASSTKNGKTAAATGSPAGTTSKGKGTSAKGKAAKGKGAATAGGSGSKAKGSAKKKKT